MITLADFQRFATLGEYPGILAYILVINGLYLFLMMDTCCFAWCIRARNRRRHLSWVEARHEYNTSNLRVAFPTLMHPALTHSLSPSQARHESIQHYLFAFQQQYTLDVFDQPSRRDFSAPCCAYAGGRRREWRSFWVQYVTFIMIHHKAIMIWRPHRVYKVHAPQPRRPIPPPPSPTAPHLLSPLTRLRCAVCSPRGRSARS